MGVAEEIALQVADAIRLQAVLPDSVRATTTHRVVTLAGEVEWTYQRDDARRAAERLGGVSEVVDTIIVRRRSLSEHVRPPAALVQRA